MTQRITRSETEETTPHTLGQKASRLAWIVATAALYWRQSEANLAARIFCTLASASALGLMLFL